MRRQSVIGVSFISKYTYLKVKGFKLNYWLCVSYVYLELIKLQLVSGHPAADVVTVPTEDDEGQGQGEEIQSN